MYVYYIYLSYPMIYALIYFTDDDVDCLVATAAKDLESFAQHAGRSVVNTEDVLLLARRNEGLQALLKQFVDDYRADQVDGKK